MDMAIEVLRDVAILVGGFVAALIILSTAGVIAGLWMLKVVIPILEWITKDRP